MDGSWGRAMFIEQLYLWHPTTRNLTDFTTNFSFVINSQNNYTYADGLTFFLNGTQLASGGSGEGLGLAKDNVTNSTAIIFIAVEFDTHNNPEKGDPAGNHVGIDINSMTSVKTVNWSSNIKEGKLNHVSISYTSSSHNLSVVLITDFTDNSTTSQSLYYNVDPRITYQISLLLASQAQQDFFFQINSIYSWSFSSTLQLPNSVESGEGKKTGLVKRHTGGDQEDGGDSDLAMDEDFEKGTGPRKFSFNELALVTTKFSEGEKLGEGGEKEHASEVKIFCRLRHRNLVQLVGWCHKKGDLLLVTSCCQMEA
ncbi:L-type lectin-domain containing receptor kinase IX.1 [Vitis vinifera]|uniref:L-type lectin-domain containing receptor kinase IX.1 n=1 Tax=Vitis vinifera TaxID=29760 RepID=A0A438FSF6_VITVI|nr:L-type lectin-domain containing receptor kinase IX.1 [Vitis vinifera]